MGLLGHLIWAVLISASAYYVYLSVSPATQVDWPKDGWFGSGQKRKDSEEVKDFTIRVSDDDIKDLKQRLSVARISHEHLEDSDDFHYGFNSNELKKLKGYWLNSFDWRKQEAIINKFKHFTTEVEGIDVHFIRQPAASGYKIVLPLLMVHGWPGNIFEFYKIIPLLTDPKAHGINSEFAFEVIAPSIPGYGWSSAPKKTGFGQMACARVFQKLMMKLGFKKFYLQGGDWGAAITSNLARMYPEQTLGLHVNMMMIAFSPKSMFIDVAASFFPSLFLSSKNLQASHNFFSKFGVLMRESGYMHIQSTKPDTIGSALNDSPLGLAAYIIEKFSTWTNGEYRTLSDGGLTKKFTYDELLTIVSIYWFNRNIVSSQRFYREFFVDPIHLELPKEYLAVPTAHASCMSELFDNTPREITQLYYNLTHYTEIPETGHFAAFENPKGIAADVFDFIKSVRK